MPKMYIYMSIGATLTCIAISFHNHCTQLSFKRVMSNFSDEMNKEFELKRKIQ